MLMEKFPGTTRRYWLDEEAGFVQRTLIVMDEEAKEQAAAARRARRK